MVHRIFLLSPAYCGGDRARLLLDSGGKSPLALRLRSSEGVPLGEVFSFLSALYFRGKLAYGQVFARPPEGVPGVLVITPNRGLLQPQRRITIEELRAFAGGEVSCDDPRYREPLAEDARALRELAPDCEAILLGSIADPKYVDVLLAVFGRRLCFPAEFVGRGDLSRGGMLLRAARSGEELRYRPLEGATRRGPRPPRLPPLSRQG